MESLPNFSNWTRPDISQETGEIERVAKALGVSVDQIREAIEKSDPRELDEYTWSKLENTDSYDVHNLGDVENLASQVSRDYKSLVDAYLSGQPMEMPIIIKQDNKFHLLSGNTRLMVARALGIIPKVLICEI